MNDFLDRFASSVAPVLAFDTDIHADHAEGLWVYDTDGNRYADFACGTAVANLGHSHPVIVAAAREQLGKLTHAGCVFRYDSILRAAERLREITPDGIEMFGFANSGAEAVEAAVKLAKYTTKRQGVVVFRGAFHGRTMGSVSYTTSNAKYRDGYHPILGSVWVAPFPHPYRWGMTDEQATKLSLDELQRIFKHEVLPKTIAAFLVEPVQGEGGYYPAPKPFLRALREMADEHGIMLVFDEVQTGFGRTAEWFASEHFGIDPDIIVLGKGIANGMPLSAYGASREVMNAWPVGAHGTTFGGNPVACAASVAGLEVMEGLLPHARELSSHAFERFRKAQIEHPTIGDVRGLGLMIGVELVKDRVTREPDAEAMRFLARYGLEHELIIISCGPDGNVIRFIPPLITTIEELDQAIDTIEAALDAYESR
ncbi:4-aminobutyrate aminotransferase GabT [bacterium BMS3Abin02]|nr:4-aminobutyrate aminotransferase GabT [bacterium BMS3Abin02]HDH26824.1 aminotransferase class III-fold pyridoxal phosphate-dependent enzyme [Actinomycetota bacterium]